jgi:hypothetical protein
MSSAMLVYGKKRVVLTNSVCYFDCSRMIFWPFTCAILTIYIWYFDHTSVIFFFSSSVWDEVGKHKCICICLCDAYTWVPEKAWEGRDDHKCICICLWHRHKQPLRCMHTFDFSMHKACLAATKAYAYVYGCCVSYMHTYMYTWKHVYTYLHTFKSHYSYTNQYVKLTWHPQAAWWDMYI